MNIISNLLESEQSETLKKPFKEPIEKVKEAILIYLEEDEDDERSYLLGVILEYLETINTLMNSAGITYTPSAPEDEEESVFQKILDNYIEIATNFLRNKETTNDFESFNAQTRYLTALVDIHRTQYVKERRNINGPRYLTLDLILRHFIEKLYINI